MRDVLLSNRVNYWTGTETRSFEREFADWCNTEHAIAVANGTVALDLALNGLGIASGDEVVVTPRTFIASVSSVVSCGASPVFADVDRHTQALSVASIEAVLTERTRAVIVVHLAGMPADMTGIMKLADKHGFYVIEDCAQAHGALHQGRRVGGIGHVGAWSFCQDKIMTTGGEGGMVTTNNDSLWRRMWAFKDHGKSYEAVYEREHEPGFRWLHDSFGTNWRLTEMQSAVGRIQLSRMSEWTRKRSENAARIAEACADLNWLRIPDTLSGDVHANYKFYAFVDPEQLAVGWTRDRIVESINAEGVPCYQGTCSEVYLEGAFKSTGLAPTERLPVARELGETSLMFLVHPSLESQHIDMTCAAIRAVDDAMVGSSRRSA